MSEGTEYMRKYGIDAPGGWIPDVEWMRKLVASKTHGANLYHCPLVGGVLLEGGHCPHGIGRIEFRVEQIHGCIGTIAEYLGVGTGQIVAHRVWSATLSRNVSMFEWTETPEDEVMGVPLRTVRAVIAATCLSDSNTMLLRDIVRRYMQAQGFST